MRLYKLSRLLWLHILAKTKESIREEPQESTAGQMDSSFVRYSDSRKAGAPPSYIEEVLRKNIELNPGNDEAYMELGLFYLTQGRLVLGLFKKAVELKTTNEHAYIALGLWKTPDDQNSGANITEAEEVLKKAIELDPRNDKAYFGLGLLYADQAKIYNAIASFKRAIEINPRNDRAYGALAALYDENGDFESSRRNYKKANDLRLEYYNPVTSENYRRLKEILDKRGVRFVCTQYPLRSIKPLQNVFEGEEGIIYIDNERVFKKAIKDYGYGRYFLDIFGGDFGHCSKEGNRLLAENIANTILKEVFHK